LCFLRKENRDTSTARSVEIPACGAFMLAERTNSHEALFTEDVEAVYFGSDEELETKVKYYSANLEARTRIATGGLERFRRSGYSDIEILDGLLASIEVAV
jgi:spore maturation protein CgeB